MLKRNREGSLQERIGGRFLPPCHEEEEEIGQAIPHQLENEDSKSSHSSHESFDLNDLQT